MEVLLALFLYAIFFVLIPALVARFFLGLSIHNLEERLRMLENRIFRLMQKSAEDSPEKSVKPEPQATESVPEASEPVAPKPALSEPPPLPPRVPAMPPKTLPPSIFEEEPSSEFSDGDILFKKLREWKVLPPEGMPLEVVLMQWWMPRVGGLLALLAMIFFGLWAAQFSSPLVKVLEMAGVACGVTAAGLFFRKRENLTVGDPLTATGTTMFYLVALAAGTFEPTKIFDSVPVALAAQIFAIAPTLLLSRGRPIPLLLGLAFSFVSAMFAVISGSGVAALATAFLAYVAAAVLGEKKNSIGLFVTGTIGAYLPLWFMKFPQTPVAEFFIWEQTEFLACIAFFVACLTLANLTFFRMKNDSVTARFIFGGNIVHALGAMLFATGMFVFANGGSISGASDCGYGLTWSATAIIFLAWTVIYFFSWKEKTFAYQLSLNVGSLALMMAAFMWFGASNDNMFYAVLAEAVLLAIVGRTTGARWSLISILVSLFTAPISLIGYAEIPPHVQIAYGIYIAVSAGTLAWFFGNPAHWSGFASLYVKRLVSAAAGIYLGASAFGCWFTDSPKTIFAIAVLAAGASFIPRFSRDVFLWLSATAAVLIFGSAFVETFSLGSSIAGSSWLLPSLALTLIAVPALRIFIKNENIGGALEIACTIATLASVSKFLANGSPQVGLAPVVALFALPIVALVLGGVWKKNSAAFPLTRRTADIAALPLVVAVCAFTWKSVGGNALPDAGVYASVALLLVTIFVPFFIPTLRALLRERPWITASLSVAGTACLLKWGHSCFPDELTALMAVLSLGLIFSGLWARIGLARGIGIALLAGTLLRLFIFDIEETIWRITAFAAVSLILFLIGYVYHRWMRRENDEGKV